MADIEKEIARRKARAAKAKKELDRAKNCKKYGLPLLSIPTSRQLEAGWKKAAREMPKEKRQAVLDAYHKRVLEGGTVGEILEECGVTHEEYLGIIKLNTKVLKFSTVNTETV